MERCRSSLAGWAAGLAATIVLLAAPAGRAADVKVIKLGVVGPLTGGFAAGGYSQLNGAKLRAEEVNETDKGLRVEILAEDDASNCSQSINLVNKLIAQGVLAILGPINSPCTLVTVPVTAQAQVPHYSVSIGTSITRQGSKWFFRMAMAADGQTRELAHFVVKERGLKKIAIMNTNDEYGQSAADGMVAAVKALGFQPAVTETWTRNDKDYTGQLSRVKAAGAEALFLTGSFTDSALIARQARQLGMEKLVLLGDTGNATPKYVELGAEAVDGTILVEPFTPADPDPKVQAFVKKFTKAFGKEPDSWSAEFYDAVGIITQAVKETGAADRTKVRDYTAALSKTKPYRGIMGSISFDEKGDPQYSLYKIEIVKGQKKILAR